MNYLLDTHTFLWSAFSPRKLSRKARSILTDVGNQVYVSAVSFWEISLKSAIGKIELQGTTPDQLPDVAREMGFALCSLNVDEAASFHRLPREEHKDPFDRMLAWQAISGRLTLISRDPEFAAYASQGLAVIW